MFKITCFEKHLRTAACIRCYFDTISLKQSGFAQPPILLKFLFQKENNLKNRESQKKKKKQDSHTYVYVMFY